MSTTGVILADRYRLEARIAAGGMGTVWRARDQLLGRPVAVKILNDVLGSDPLAVERFRREATTAASMSHPNMANVFDYVEHDGRPGIVMELIEGETLAARLTREGPLPVGEALRIADLVLRALGAAHAAGIVHRDIKPANILLTPAGEVKVADFGIARTTGDATLTQAGAVLGTAHYSSPEQVRGSPATAISDLYSFGVVLYEMLTGQRPFDAETPVATALMRLSNDPDPPRTHRPDLPIWLDRIVVRAIAREPDARFADAESMRAALLDAEAPPTPAFGIHDHDTMAFEAAAVAAPTDVTRAYPVAAPPEPRPPRTRDPVRPVRALIAWLAPLLLGLVIGGLIVVLRGPSIVEVPAFTNMKLAEARALATERGLVLDLLLRDSVKARNVVLSQDPAPDATVSPGATILVRVSNGVAPCCEVPNLIGLTLEEAQAALEDARLTLGETSPGIRDGAEPGTVFAQDPDGGADLEPGDAVDVVYAPDVQGGDKDDEKGKGRGHGNDG